MRSNCAILTLSQQGMLTSNDNMYLKELDEWQPVEYHLPKCTENLDKYEMNINMLGGGSFGTSESGCV